MLDQISAGGRLGVDQAAAGVRVNRDLGFHRRTPTTKINPGVCLNNTVLVAARAGGYLLAAGAGTVGLEIGIGIDFNDARFAAATQGSLCFNSDVCTCALVRATAGTVDKYTAAYRRSA